MKRGIFYAFTGVKTVPGTISVARNVAKAIPAVVFAALVATSAVNCKGHDDITGQEQTQEEIDAINEAAVQATLDKNGFRKNGDRYYYNSDGKGTGQWTQYDPKGYDCDGFNEQGRDKDGYNKDGIDVNGFVRLNPIQSVDFPGNENMDKYNVGRQMRVKHTELLGNINAVVEQFLNNAHSPNEVALKNSVQRSQREFEMAGVANKGDHIVQSAIQGASHYVDALIGLFPENERAEFELMLNTYRTQCYVDSRAKKKDEPNYIPANGELTGFYTQLGSKVQSGEIKAYVFNCVPDIAIKLGVNPGFLKSLLYQLSSDEGFYSLVDDAKALGIDPVKGEQGWGYTTEIGYRSLNSIRAILNDPNWIKAQ